MDNDTLSNIRGCIYASCTTEGASKLSDALDEYASKLGEAAERGALMSNELDVLVADRDQWKGRADQLSEERDSLEGRLEEREKERSALSSRLAQYAQASLAPGNEQRKRIADLEDRLDSYRRAIGLIRAKAVIWPSCAAAPAQWFQEIIDVCDLATTQPVVEIPTTNEPLGVYAHRLLKTKARLDE